ncbi:MAG TPA: hypothetical protein EYP04_00855 [Anaerolineae bacterium]|nr:hypothetical protein [Anaerolineae bacterium]
MGETRTTYIRGARLVWRYLYLDGAGQPAPPDEALREGIQLLESIRKEHDSEVNWILGKAYEAAGEFARSAERFAAAYAANSERRETIHEYAIALLRIGLRARAFEVLEAADGGDPLLVFDRALTLYACGDHDEARMLLDGFEWPASFVGRVTELRNRAIGAAQQDEIGSM